jgi:hypothetical protein
VGFFSNGVDKIIEAGKAERERRAAEEEANKKRYASSETIDEHNESSVKTPQVKELNMKEVVVTDIDISFGSMVWLMIKFAFATIPAAIVVGTIYFFSYAFLAGFLNSR